MVGIIMVMVVETVLRSEYGHQIVTAGLITLSSYLT